MSLHKHFFVAVHAFFIQDGSVLLSRRKQTGYMDGYFSVPAGHLDGGETVGEAMAREIREETEVIVSTDLLPAHVMHRTKNNEERIDYFFVIESWRGEIKNGEREKCEELVWAPLKDMPTKEIIPYILFALKRVMEKQVFSEYRED